MRQNSVTVTINAPAETVFSHLTVGSLRLKWIEGLRKSAYAPRGAAGVGKRLEETIFVRGKHYDTAADVVELVPNRRFVLKVSNEGFDSTATYAIEGDGGRTLLTFVQERTYKSWLGDLMGAVVTRAAQKHFEADFNALRRLIEAGQQRPSPSR